MKSPVIDRAAIQSSAEFRAYVESESIAAQRRRDDAITQIEERKGAKARATQDLERKLSQIDDEIASLQDEVEDADEIIDGAERLLKRPPKLTQRGQ